MDFQTLHADSPCLGRTASTNSDWWLDLDFPPLESPTLFDFEGGDLLAIGNEGFLSAFDEAATAFETPDPLSSSSDEEEEEEEVEEEQSYLSSFAAPQLRPSRAGFLCGLIPSIIEPQAEPKPQPIQLHTTRSGRVTTKLSVTDTEEAPLVIPEEGGDLFVHLQAMPQDLVVPRFPNLQARQARLYRKQRLADQRFRRQVLGGTRTHYEERSVRAQGRKRKGGKFESEGKKPFVSVTELA